MLLVPAPRRAMTDSNYSGRPSQTAWGTVLTASGTPHSLGTITELIAAIDHTTAWIEINFSNTSTAATITDMLVNIYTGAGGSEVLLIDSLAAGWVPDYAVAAGRSYVFPLRIPKGTRISAAARALIASDTVACQILLHAASASGRQWAGSGVETLGQVTASSRGTSITPGGASEGAFASIGTTARRWRYVVPYAMGNNDTTLTGEAMALDIGTGSAVISGLEDFGRGESASEYQVERGLNGRWCDIASGTALQMRAQGSGTPSGVQYGLLYGVY